RKGQTGCLAHFLGQLTDDATLKQQGNRWNKECAMNSRIRSAAISLLGLSIAVVLLLACPEVNRSRAKARAVVPVAELRTGTTAVEEETVTLSPANLKIWEHYYDSAHGGKASPCGVHPENIPGSIVAGIKELAGCLGGS